MADIVMYGAEWCGDCRRAKRVFDEHGIDYLYVDVDADPAARETVQEMNGGRLTGILPTIVFPDGSTLVEPSDAELLNKLIA